MNSQDQYMTIYKMGGTVTHGFQEEVYNLKNGRQIFNMCSLPVKDFMAEIGARISVELLKTIDGPYVGTTSEGSKVYGVKGEPCLLIK